jgi:hypothetical protein
MMVWAGHAARIFPYIALLNIVMKETFNWNFAGLMSVQ